MASPAENPFTALTIVVAPAILTNASSLLCFGTANRLARVMHRTRAVSAQLAGEGLNEGNRAMYEHQLRELSIHPFLYKWRSSRYGEAKGPNFFGCETCARA